MQSPFHVILTPKDASESPLPAKTYDLGIFTPARFHDVARLLQWVSQDARTQGDDMPNVITAWQAEDYHLLCLPLDESLPACWYVDGHFNPIAPEEDPRR